MVILKHAAKRALDAFFGLGEFMIYRKYSIVWFLLLLATVVVSFSGCKAVLHRAEEKSSPDSSTTPNAPDLNGLWVMGNATSGTETATIIRIEQNAQNIRGIIKQPSKDYAEQYGVKRGDLEFEGIIEGQSVRGKVHSYQALDVKEKCPKLPSVMLKDFEMSLVEDKNSLDGWTINNRVNIEKFQEYTKGRSAYTFQRLNQQNTQ